MTNPGVAFDKNLIQPPGEANASLAGIPLRLNPTSVSLPYNLRINQTQTIGGMVIQLYGVEWGDLVVQGQFGAGGWQEQAKFFSMIKNLVGNTTIAAQLQQVQPDQTLVNPSGSVRFTFPLLNYDFMVFIKSYGSLEGNTVELFNENINPTWQLTMTIDNDNTALDQIATDQFITRLAQGLGYSTNKGYNGPGGMANAAGDLQTYMQNYASDQSLLQTFQQAYGSGVNSSSSSTTGSAATALPASTIPSGNQLSLIQQAFKIANVPDTQANEQAVNIIITHESSWNANAINNTDSNAAAGDPSRGLMQVIMTTFQAHALAPYNTNIYDPLSNIIAGVRYAISRYGSLLQVPGVVAVSNGQPYVGY